MRFEININKKHLILLVVLFAFVSLVIAQNGNYNPGHSGDQISVRNSNLATVIDTMVATTSILSQRVDAHTDQITALESAPSFEIVGEGTKTINSPRFISEGTEWVNLLDSRDFRLSGTQWSENTYLVVISDLSINNQFEHIFQHLQQEEHEKAKVQYKAFLQPHLFDYYSASIQTMLKGLQDHSYHIFSVWHHRSSDGMVCKNIWN